jgi:formylmethanofuran dehydrogenase subunit A
LVPFRYRDRNFVNALQWAIGLELFLLVKDPWRIFLTTDHPNGGPFTSYPQIARLLMDRGYRDECLAAISAAARKASVLGGIEREYSLSEIAVMTRAGPARSLGLGDHGRLSAGAFADVVVYRQGSDMEAMLREPVSVLKRGTEVARAGKVLTSVAGATQVVRPGYDRQIEKRLRRFFGDHMSLAFDHFALRADEIAEAGGRVEEQLCRAETGRP